VQEDRGAVLVSVLAEDEAEPPPAQEPSQTLFAYSACDGTEVGRRREHALGLELVKLALRPFGTSPGLLP
jgi:hypothetical protein